MDICHGLKRQGLAKGGLGEAALHVNIQEMFLDTF